MVSFLECLKQFGIKNQDDIYDLSQNPTRKDLIKAFRSISAKLREGKYKTPCERILVISLFACHGILKSGLQNVVFNEYDKDTGFYVIQPIENMLRDWSKMYLNSYIISIFACCRQIYDKQNVHTGCVPSRGIELEEVQDSSDDDNDSMLDQSSEDAEFIETRAGYTSFLRANP